MLDVGASRVAILLATLLGGCLIDPDAPCGDRLQEDASGACVCPGGSELSEGVCVPVPEDSANASGGDGSAANPTACEPGARCSCSSSQECPPGELCDVYDSGRCVAAPAGLGASCGGSADCAGTEATFCESFSTRTCQVQGCAERAGVCPGDLVCCDYRVLGTSLCIPADAAPGGGCPAPGQLVMRSGSP